ncbi:hypothetical protein WCQ02_31340 [Paraburkholderia tropica]|uniref:hypothetical protein n=1 Tax=Paraburkholderia tropica TaxID=92647 RepID=UPI003016FF28
MASSDGLLKDLREALYGSAQWGDTVLMSRAIDLIEQQAHDLAALREDIESQIRIASEEAMRAAGLAIHLEAMTKEFVRMFPLYYYAEPWAHDRNQVLKAAQAVIAKEKEQTS